VLDDNREWTDLAQLTMGQVRSNQKVLRILVAEAKQADVEISEDAAISRLRPI
jgi:hypothetical protein